MVRGSCHKLKVIFSPFISFSYEISFFCYNLKKQGEFTIDIGKVEIEPQGREIEGREIQQIFYKDKEKAKKWRDNIMTIIHPDRSTHPKAIKSAEILNEIYQDMMKYAK